jgi:hypothetical protein
MCDERRLNLFLNNIEQRRSATGKFTADKKTEVVWNVVCAVIIADYSVTTISILLLSLVDRQTYSVPRSKPEELPSDHLFHFDIRYL